jgi:hypothetical protein
LGKGIPLANNLVEHNHFPWRHKKHFNEEHIPRGRATNTFVLGKKPFPKEHQHFPKEQIIFLDEQKHFLKEDNPKK